VRNEPLERYLNSLAKELRWHGMFNDRILAEAKEHLLDAIESGIHRGLGVDGATNEALQRFGTARVVAAAAFDDQFRIVYRVLVVIAVLMGAAIAFVDSRPSWDDTGITVFAMAGSAGLLGIVAPYRPWLWGVAIGAATAAVQVVHQPTFGSKTACLAIIAIPVVGSYVGMLCRRKLATPLSG
jgi:hypothetical protein